MYSSKVNFIVFLIFFFIIGPRISLVNGKTNSPSLANSNKKEIPHLEGVFNGFEENRGQLVDDQGNTMPEVLFKTSSGGVVVYITTSGISYFFTKNNTQINSKRVAEKNFEPGFPEMDKVELEWNRIDMTLRGSSLQKNSIIKLEESSNYSNFYLPHCPEGISGVKRYQKIIIQNIYPGIDWVLYNQHEKGMTYDFIVHPGANPNDIVMNYNGIRELTVEQDNKLRITSLLGEISEGGLICYNENKNIVPSEYVVNGNEVQFEIQNYDNSKDLIIDPPLIWATYYGGAGGTDQGHSLTTDLKGNLYVRGFTNSTDFPVKSVLGSYNQGMVVANKDMFVLKFDSNGVLLWGTFYGGTLTETSYIDRDEHGIAFDEFTQSLYVVAGTNSPNLPVQDVPGGTDYFQASNAGAWDGFIVKFNASGVRLWATYYGGTLSDYLNGVDVDALGNVFAVGYTNSTNLTLLDPGNGAYFQNTLTPLSLGMVILKFNRFSEPLWMTLYAGLSSTSANGLTVDKKGNLYVVGISNAANFPSMLNPVVGTYFQPNNGGNYDAVIVKFDNNGVREWGTNYGGSGFDRASSVTTDDDLNVYITGATASTNFPIQNKVGAFNQAANGGSYDIFILKFDSNTVRKWATYYGGLLDEGDGGVSSGPSIKMVKNKSVYVVGKTNSANFSTYDPGVCTYYQSLPGGASDICLLEFDSSGVRKWATYYGGLSDENAAAVTSDFRGNIYITGHSRSINFPTRDQQGGSYYQPAIAANNSDMILLKLGDPLLEADYTFTTVCFGDSTHFTNASLGIQSAWEWDFDDPASLFLNNTSTLQNPAHLFTSAGTYDVRLIVSDACVKDTIIYSVIVNRYPKINNIPNVTVCDKYNLPVITGSGLTGNESYYTGSMGTGSAIIAGTAITSTTTLYLFDESATIPNCFDEDTIVITLNKTPIVTNVTKTCNITNTGYNVSFDVSGGNGGPYTVTENAPGGTGGLFIGNTWRSNQIADNTAFDFDVKESANCPFIKVSGIKICNCLSSAGTMNKQKLNLCAADQANAIHNADQVLDNNDKMVYVLHTGNGGSLGTVLDTNTSPIFVFFSSLNYGTTYYVSAVVGDSTASGKVDFASGCVSVASGTPVVWNAIPSANISGDNTICSGSSSNLLFTLTGTGNFNVVYTDGASNFNAFGISNGYTLAVSPTSTTTYSIVSVKDNANSCIGTVSGSATITVNPVPSPDFNAPVGKCVGDPTIISFTGVSPAGSVYNWDFDGGTKNSGSGAGPYDISWSSIGKKKVSLYITANGCISDKAEKLVTINAVPTSTFTMPDTVCTVNGALIKYSGTSSPAASYNWDFDNGTIVYSSGYTEYQITWPTSGDKNVKLMVSDEGCNSILTTNKVYVRASPEVPIPNPGYYCQNGPSSALTATGSNVLWYSDSTGGAGSTTAPVPSTAFVDTISYFVSQSSGGCESSRTRIKAIIYPIPAAPVTTPLIYCQNDVSLPLTAIGSNLLWFTDSVVGTGSSINPIPVTTDTGSFNYYVSQRVNNCESPRSELNIKVKQKPISSNPFADDDVLCEGETLSMHASGVNGTNYLWQGDNGKSFNIKDPAKTNVDTSYSGIYTLKTDLNGCPGDDVPLIIEVNLNPELILLPEITVCRDSLLLISAIEKNNLNISTWKWTASNPCPIMKPDSVKTFVQPGDSTTLTLTAISNKNCMSSSSIKIITLPYPIPYAGPDAEICMGVEVDLDGQGGEQGTAQYRWSPEKYFIDPTLSSQKFLTNNPGRYDLVFSVNESNCVKRDTLTVVVNLCEPPGVIKFPEAYSPNGDGNNDFFLPALISDMVTYRLRIFNRWGEMVFETVEPELGWDGTFAGQEAMQGVYVYLFDGKGKDGMPVNLNGTFMLMK